MVIQYHSPAPLTMNGGGKRGEVNRALALDPVLQGLSLS